MTLLMCACVKGRYRCVQLLLEMGADLNAKDDGGFTPFMFACWAGHPRVVRLLLAFPSLDTTASGTPPMTSACGEEGPYTAAVWACKQGHVSVMSTLRIHEAGRLLLLRLQRQHLEQQILQ